jgi:hypothetical protein
MDQTIINFILGLFGMVLGFMLRVLWQSVKDLRNEDSKLIEKVGAIEILVAGQYIKRDEFQQLTHAIFKKLDKIEDKLNKKEDRV